jgi:hypothetical protein
MSATGSRSIIWANGEDVFCIAKVGLILDLEDKCKAGFSVVMARLENGVWGLNDVRETIRLGLIGGGMKPDKAMEVVRRHVDENPLAQSVLVAYEILKAAMFGVPDDPVGVDPKKEEPAEAPVTGSTTTTDASDGQK